MFRSLVVVTLTAGALVAGSLAGPVTGGSVLGPVAAEAAQSTAAKSTVTRSYSSYRMAWVDRFNLCLGVHLSGKIRATKYVESVEGGAWVRLAHPRIIDPAMSVTMKKSCDDNADFKRYHRANTVQYNSYYYGYSCSYNPSFSVGYPWSVGVGITPDCGEKKVARLGDTQKRARRAYRFQLVTDGRAFSWKATDSDTAPTTLKLCTSASGFIVLRDTEGAVRDKAMKKVRFPDPCIRVST